MRRGLVMRLVAPCFASFSRGLSVLAGAGTQVSGPVAHDNLAGAEIADQVGGPD